MKANDPKLKHEMARLLPEVISPNGYGEYFWIDGDRPIPEESWLYVMQLVESSVSGKEIVDYTKELIKETGSTPPDYISYGHGNYLALQGVACLTFACADFDQRARAMCRVKGIQIS